MDDFSAAILRITIVCVIGAIILGLFLLFMHTGATAISNYLNGLVAKIMSYASINP